MQLQYIVGCILHCQPVLSSGAPVPVPGSTVSTIATATATISRPGHKCCAATHHLLESQGLVNKSEGKDGRQ